MYDEYEITRLGTEITYRKGKKETFQDFCNKIKFETRDEDIKIHEVRVWPYNIWRPWSPDESEAYEHEVTYDSSLEERANYTLYILFKAIPENRFKRYCELMDSGILSFSEGIIFSKSISGSQFLDEDFLADLSILSLSDFLYKKLIAKKELIKLLQDLFDGKTEYKDFVEKFSLNENIQTAIPWKERNKLLLNIQKTVRESIGLEDF